MSKLADIVGGHQDDILTLETFTQQFKEQTQRGDYYEPSEQPSGIDDIPPDLIDPNQESHGGADTEPDDTVWQPSDEQRESSPERYAKTGREIARFIDTGFNFTAQNLIAKDSEKNYNASEKDLEDLGDAWSEIAEDKQWDMGPVPRLILLYVVIYGPLTQRAFHDRRVKELERRADETDSKMKQQDDRIRELENELRRKNAAGENK